MTLFKPAWMSLAPNDTESKKYYREARRIMRAPQEELLQIALEADNKDLALKATAYTQIPANLERIVREGKYANVRLSAAKYSKKQELIAYCFEHEQDMDDKYAAAKLITDTKYLPLISEMDQRRFKPIADQLAAKKREEDFEAFCQEIREMENLDKLEDKLYTYDYPEEDKDRMYKVVAERIQQLDESRLLYFMLNYTVTLQIEKAIIGSMKNLDYLEEIKETKEHKDIGSRNLPELVRDRIREARKEKFCPRDIHDWEYVDTLYDSYNEDVRIETWIYKCKRCGYMYEDERWTNGITDKRYYWPMED